MSSRPSRSVLLALAFAASDGKDPDSEMQTPSTVGRHVDLLDADAFSQDISRLDIYRDDTTRERRRESWQMRRAERQSRPSYCKGRSDKFRDRRSSHLDGRTMLRKILYDGPDRRDDW